MKNPQKVWSLVGLFIIALVVSLPFESAQTLAASVSITKNEGQKGIEGFIDANGDTWTVEATITDTQAQVVDPKNVKMKVGTHEAEFDSCSDSGLGKVCHYISPLNDGVR